MRYIMSMIAVFFARRWMKNKTDYSHQKMSRFLYDMRIGYIPYIRRNQIKDMYIISELNNDKFRKNIVPNMTGEEVLSLVALVSKVWINHMHWQTLSHKNKETTIKLTHDIILAAAKRVRNANNDKAERANARIDQYLKKATAEIALMMEPPVTEEGKSALVFKNLRINGIASACNDILSKNPTYKARYRRIMMILKDADGFTSAPMREDLLDKVEEKLVEHAKFYAESVNVSESETQDIAHKVAVDMLKSL